MKIKLLIWLKFLVLFSIDENKAIEAEFNNQDYMFDKYGNDYLEEDEFIYQQNNEKKLNNFNE